MNSDRPQDGRPNSRWPGKPSLRRAGTGLLLGGMALAFHLAFAGGSVSPPILSAAVVGGYLAINIGANDGANNIGLAVGSGALTLGAAILLTTFFEIAGTLMAGAPVGETLREGILIAASAADNPRSIMVLLSGMLGGAVWLNLACAAAIPVSTTHSFVGGLVGAGMAAYGWHAVQWDSFLHISLIWILAPLFSALVAGAMLYLLKHSLTYQADVIGAAKVQVPILLALFSGLFSSYLLLNLDRGQASTFSGPTPLLGLSVALGVFLLVQPRVYRKAQTLKNNKEGVNGLLVLPLVFTSALFSFSHGANDVANVTGPLVRILEYALADTGRAPAQSLWLPAAAGIGVVFGIAAFGHRVIRTVGTEITELDNLRALCVSLAAAMTILLATHYGIPVSTTHIVVGGVFGVGLLREYLKSGHRQALEEIRRCFSGQDPGALADFLKRFEHASLQEKRASLADLKTRNRELALSKKERKKLKQRFRQQLVKRALLGGLLYVALQGLGSNLH